MSILMDLKLNFIGKNGDKNTWEKSMGIVYE